MLRFKDNILDLIILKHYCCFEVENFTLNKKNTPKRSVSVFVEKN